MSAYQTIRISTCAARARPFASHVRAAQATRDASARREPPVVLIASVLVAAKVDAAAIRPASHALRTLPSTAVRALASTSTRHPARGSAPELLSFERFQVCRPTDRRGGLPWMTAASTLS